MLYCLSICVVGIPFINDSFNSMPPTQKPQLTIGKMFMHMVCQAAP